MAANTLTELRSHNAQIDILELGDPEFERYGRVRQAVRLESGLEFARQQAGLAENFPQSVVYEASVPGLEASLELVRDLTLKVYGGMPIQLGWCYGRNSMMSALEYHRGSEAIVAVTDVLVLLGDYRDIQWSPEILYESLELKAFYVPQGSLVELYAGTLHYAPLQVHAQEGFCTLVGLPRGTNLDLESRPPRQGESALLFACNKWLLAHPDEKDLVQAGAYAGIRGENIRVEPI